MKTKKLKKLSKEAFDYFSKLNICPVGEDIVGYVADAIEEEKGINLTQNDYELIAEKIKINLD